MKERMVQILDVGYFVMTSSLEELEALRKYVDSQMKLMKNRIKDK